MKKCSGINDLESSFCEELTNLGKVIDLKIKVYLFYEDMLKKKYFLKLKNLRYNSRKSSSLEIKKGGTDEKSLLEKVSVHQLREVIERKKMMIKQISHEKSEVQNFLKCRQIIDL